MTARLYRLISLSVAVVTTALLLCAPVFGQKSKRPEVALPNTWTAESVQTGEPVEKWWTSFNDAELNKLIDRAVAANLDLKVATARVAEARAAAGIARAGLLPSVDASAAASRNRQRVIGPPRASSSSPSFVPIEFNNFQAGFDAAWELDVFGSVRHSVQAARADAHAAAEARRAVLVTVLAEVGRSYIDLRGLQLRLDIAEKNIKIQQDTLDLTESRAKAGLATELDVSRARAQLEATRSVVPTLQSGIEIAIHRLSVLLGEQPDALQAELGPTSAVPVLPPAVPAGLPSELLERRPDIREAEAGVEAATARRGEAKADFFPRFVIAGSAGRQASQLHDLSLGMGNFFGVGPAISLPIFTGGRLRSQLHVQDARLEQAVVTYRAAVLSALEDTEDALVSYSQEQVRRERLESAVRSNADAVHLSSETYRAGLTDFLSVLDAQRELYANEDLLAQSRTEQAVNLIALYKALGGGWQSFPQP